MDHAADLVSPKQVARAIGVSESSLKRWCDQGRIKTVRTVGGHRKMAVAAVLQFVRDTDQQLAAPEILGLPAVSEYSSLGLVRGKDQLVDALLAGDDLLSRRIVFDLYLAKHSLSVVFDEVVAAAFREIGDRWACHRAEVYQERRGCEIVLRTLSDIRRIQLAPVKPWIAIGGTIEGDLYSLPSAMAAAVLRDVGFQATSLGSSIPFASHIAAIEQIRPMLFWLSVSAIPEGLDFVGEFAALSRACSTAGAALVVGGRALTEELRQRMTYSAYCDNMQHLEGFATTLLRSLSREKSSPTRPRRTGAKAFRAKK
jgi:methanogenic corrinoid protein MtbC1